MSSLLQKSWKVKTPYEKIPLLDRVTKHRHLDLQNELTDLHSPWSMKGMKKAVERIQQAIQDRERIMIFGDYDVDGVCGASILYLGMKELGANVSVRLPHREKDGYGLNMKVIDECTELGVKVLITVDCGISNVKEVQYGMSKGIDVIVTDHHSIPPVLPKAFAILNPKQKDCQYPEKEIVGTVVAYKLLNALSLSIPSEPSRRVEESLVPATIAGSKLHLEPHCRDTMAPRRAWSQHASDSFRRGGRPSTGLVGMGKKYIDLAALATVADCAPLRGENRLIVKLGLKQFEQTEHRGLRKLLESYQLLPAHSNSLTPKSYNLKPISSYHLGFNIAPCINAAGRLEDPMIAFQMMLGDEAKAVELRQLNEERQGIVKLALEEAFEIVEAKHKTDPAIVIWRESWQPGIIGLLAGRLCEKYGRPAICLTLHNGKYVGSCRSIPEINIVEELRLCEGLFIGYGGHAQAAGLSIRGEHLETFRDKIHQNIGDRLKDRPQEASLFIDTEIIPEEITLETSHQLTRLEPFGMGNPKPKFLLRNMTVLETRPVGNDRSHLQLKLANSDGEMIKAIAFLMADHEKILLGWKTIDLVAQLNPNTWNGSTTVDLSLIDVRQAVTPEIKPD